MCESLTPTVKSLERQQCKAQDGIRMGDRATLVSALAERIHAKIASGEYQVGSRLRQEDLAKAFKVSRTPVREALRQLEAKGVISHAHGHSAIIRAASPREIREIYQIRAELEGFAAQL